MEAEKLFDEIDEIVAYLINQLENDLKAAIDNEEYEKAGLIQIELDKIKKEINK